MDNEAVESVGDRLTGRTARGKVGPEHEVIDEKLGAAAEQVRKRRRPLIGVECVVLVDPDPGQFQPLPGDLVAPTGQLLLCSEQLSPGRQPFFPRPFLVHGSAPRTAPS